MQSDLNNFMVGSDNLWVYMGTRPKFQILSISNGFLVIDVHVILGTGVQYYSTKRKIIHQEHTGV